jgi:hypothetical protein
MGFSRRKLSQYIESKITNKRTNGCNEYLSRNGFLRIKGGTGSLSSNIAVAIRIRKQIEMNGRIF